MFRFQRRCRDFSFSATMPILFVSVNDAETCFMFSFPATMQTFISVENDETSFISRRQCRDFFLFRRRYRDFYFPSTFRRRCRDIYFLATMPRLLISFDDAETSFISQRQCQDLSILAMMPRLSFSGDDAETFRFQRRCRYFYNISGDDADTFISGDDADISFISATIKQISEFRAQLACSFSRATCVFRTIGKKRCFHHQWFKADLLCVIF